MSATKTRAKADETVKSFTYEARDSDGKVVSGTAKAERSEDVVRELLTRNLVPLKVKGGGAAGAGLQTDITLRKTAKPRELVLVTRQMAAMIDSGLDYIEAIDVVRGDCEDQILRSALGEVRAEIQNGIPFSQALKNRGEVFPPVVVNLITAGEASGDIKGAMNAAADTLDAADQLRAKVKKAMMYPMVVTAVTVLIIVFMLVYLVPQFTATFKELGGPDTKLPGLTQMVVHASNIAKIVVPLSFVGFVPAFIAYKRVKHRDNVREVVDPFKMKLPVFGKLFHKIALARFCRNLSGLLNAGVDRIEALEISARTVGNIQMERAVMAARKEVTMGRPFVEPLKAEPLFPAMLIQFVEAGDKSGRTGFMLGKAAEIYDRDVDQVTDNMTALIEPLLLAFAGVCIGLIVIAIYLPYLSVGDVISGT